MHWYGLRSRPYGFGHTPPDATEIKVIDSEEALSLFPNAGHNVRYGAVGYDEPLLKRQFEAFELQPLFSGLSPESITSLIDKDMKRLKERAKRNVRKFGKDSEQARAATQGLRKIRALCWEVEDAAHTAIKEGEISVDVVVRNAKMSNDLFHLFFPNLSKALHKETDYFQLSDSQKRVYMNGL